MSCPRRQNSNVTSMHCNLMPNLAAQHQPRLPRREPQHLVRRRMIVMEVINSIARLRPAILNEYRQNALPGPRPRWGSRSGKGAPADAHCWASSRSAKAAAPPGSSDDPLPPNAELADARPSPARMELKRRRSIWLIFPPSSFFRDAGRWLRESEEKSGTEQIWAFYGGPNFPDKYGPDHCPL